MSKQFRNIYLIDDDEITNAMNEEIFIGIELAENIVVFADSSKALESLADHYSKPDEEYQFNQKDILFLDINMPKMDGFEFLENLYSLVKHPKLEIVLLTTSSNLKDIEKSREFNIRNYIKKPISEGKIWMAVEQINQG